MSTDFDRNWRTQLRKGVLELCILRALDGSRRYGYEIARTLRGISGLVIGEGTIYPILNRLKREAFVETSVEESPDGPPRKYYQLTRRGREQLGKMIAHWESLSSGIGSLPTGGEG